jgi:endonuclease YncB( thermonuclease family)
MTTSMVPSWGDGGFDFGIETTRAWSGKLGKPLVLDGDITSANHTLVKNGWCWWDRKYAPRNTELARREQNARETKQGLWVGQIHIPSWQWRKRTR